MSTRDSAGNYEIISHFAHVPPPPAVVYIIIIHTRIQYLKCLIQILDSFTIIIIYLFIYRRTPTTITTPTVTTTCSSTCRHHTNSFSNVLFSLLSCTISAPQRRSISKRMCDWRRCDKFPSTFVGKR